MRAEEFSKTVSIFSTLIVSAENGLKGLFPEVKMVVVPWGELTSPGTESSVQLGGTEIWHDPVLSFTVFQPDWAFASIAVMSTISTNANFMASLPTWFVLNCVRYVFPTAWSPRIGE